MLLASSPPSLKASTHCSCLGRIWQTNATALVTGNSQVYTLPEVTGNSSTESVSSDIMSGICSKLARERFGVRGTSRSHPSTTPSFLRLKFWIVSNQVPVVPTSPNKWGLWTHLCFLLCFPNPLYVVTWDASRLLPTLVKVIFSISSLPDVIGHIEHVNI